MHQSPISRPCLAFVIFLLSCFSEVFGEEPIQGEGFEKRNLISVVDAFVQTSSSSSTIEIGSDGLPVISYWDVSADRPKVAKCNDVSCSGGDETITTIDSAGTPDSMAIGTDGFPIIALTAPDLLKTIKCNDLACTGGDETVTVLDSGIGDSNASIAISEAGYPVIAYSVGSLPRKLMVVSCNDLACEGNDETYGTVYEVIGDGPREPFIVIGQDGFPVIVYSVVEIIPSKLLVAKCNDAACTGGDETISTIHPLSANVGNSSMKIGIDGFPVISFQAGASGLAAIKVAKCNDEACSGGDETVSIVDDLPSSNGSPHFTSIGIGLDGNPLISYRKTTASIPALKVAKCNDPACAGGNERITTVDSEDQAGVFGISIVIGDDGLPLVSHQRIGDGLKVVHCSVSDCDP